MNRSFDNTHDQSMEVYKTLTGIVQKQTAWFLERTLPRLHENWWNLHVVYKLEGYYDRQVHQPRPAAIKDLDFAAMLFLLQENLKQIAEVEPWDQDAWAIITYMRGVRNRYAHIPSSGVGRRQIIRDYNAILEFMELVGVSKYEIDKIRRVKLALDLEWNRGSIIHIKVGSQRLRESDAYVVYNEIRKRAKKR